jgi:protein-tyrosine phosphatase
MKSVLFVCTANQCRSPIAEAIFRDKVAKLGQLNDWEIASAGTWAEPDKPAMPLAQQVMLRRGLSVDAHRSRHIDKSLIDSFALILVMTENHREGLAVEFPEAAHKIQLISRMIGPAFDIDDPVGRSEAHYQTCANELADIIEHGFNRISHLAEAQTNAVSSKS